MKKNKLLKIFITAILLISIQISVIASATGVVNTDTVRVRAKATTESSIVALVSIGDKITITGEEGNWYKVKAKDEDGEIKTGYIRKDLLTVDGDISAIISNENNEDNKEKPVENNNENDTENNQEKPSENNSGNTQEQPTENNNNAEQPDENNNSSEGEEPSETEEPTNNEQTPGETTNENIPTTNVKNKTISTIKRTSSLSEGNKIQLTQNTKIKILPSANSSNIAELQANTEATVLEVINSWCRIETEGACGWVRIDQ